MHVPASCDTCGAVFRSGIVVEDRTPETLAGKESSACPVCGNPGRVRGDAFGLIEESIRVLSAPERTTEELAGLVVLLSQALQRKETSEEIVRRIGAELPGMSAITELVPKTGAGLNSFISMTVAISALLSTKERDGNGFLTLSTEEALSHIFNETNIAARSLRPVLQSTRRNEACPCGSGKRYKRCCGQLSPASNA